MDHVDELLRDELRRLSAQAAPDTSAMLGRVRRRRRRGRLIAGLSALAVLVVAVGAVLALRPADPAPIPAAEVPADARMTDPPQLYFADPDHGFALLTRCAGSACEGWLGTTADGGRSWQAHQVPGLVGNGRDPHVRLRVLDATRVALDAWEEPTRWFTADAGRTWAQRSRQPEGTVAEVPPTGLATIETNAGRPMGVLVLLPDGRTARLATPPPAPIIAALDDAMVGADGSLWLQGGNDDRSWLYVTRNRGRTWAEVPMPAGLNGPGRTGSTMLRPDDGHLVYAVDQQARAVWRTTDDGRHWRRLTLALPAKTEDAGVVALAQRGGGLLVLDPIGGQQYSVGAGEDRFKPAGPVQTVGPIGARYLRGTPRDPQPTYAHSVDGRDWTEFPF
jgi:photosystem II stability/assembly factor-like uncharacterized protein